MAKGTEDWVRRIDISIQSTAEVDNRIKNGAADVLTFAGLADASTTKTLGTVTGKGMVYGGFIASQGVDIQHDDYLSLVIDGTTIYIPTFEQSVAWNQIRPNGPVLYLTIFDEVLFRYAMMVGPGVTFETSFVIRYTEAHGRTPAVSVGLMYALV